MRPRKGWQRERERLRTGMEPVDAHEEVHGVGRRARGGERLGGWGLMQAAGCCALSGYAVWALLLMPGFRRVPLRLQVPYLPASPQQVNNVMRLLGGRSGPLADLGSGDGRIVLEACRRGFSPAMGYELNPWLLAVSRLRAWRAGLRERASFQRRDLWKVDLSNYDNVTVFLAPSVLHQLEHKLATELPDGARVVAGRFPLPTWAPAAQAGDGEHRAWLYHVQRSDGTHAEPGQLPGSHDKM
uniref:Adenine nucleotide translocase lysine N-methyltransferase isoform X1 n=3 Tax=Petromyzon marinus TaxID=7757 RepID=A0AAJ7TR43_PETMA|nr:adenine nucleotide translocase lysine N-methyltransferase isoform X1 [Petromyzon marinus]